MLKRTLVMALAGSQMLVSSLVMAEEDRSAVLERIKPVGTVAVEGQKMPVITKTEVAPPPAAEPVAAAAPAAPIAAAAPAAAPAPAAAIDGAAIYQQACFACHATGAANAPKLGDKAAWAPRLPNGKAALLNSVLKGKGAMPPKGGRMDLSDEQISAAVDYLIQAAQ
ncbi:MAG: cytochrome c5 family protein [Gammaproteobacteria bacterium]|nr:c-type cytochrome [Gammaproteobacteria bacterium]NNJ90980.1 cytochrome c5 family protein [Gammaproteobacteria bacterium]